MSTETLIDNIKIALFQTSNEQRMQAEQKVMEKMQAQPTEFLQELISTMTNQSQALELRHGCGVILKRALDMPKNTQSQQGIWDIADNIKEQIKQALLDGLMCPEDNIRSSIANAIATIFGLEINNKSWLGVIQNLINEIQNSTDLLVQKTTLQTLGLMCEQLKIKNSAYIQDETFMQNILRALCLKINVNEANESLKLYAIKALEQCLPIFTNIFVSQKEIREQFQQILLQLGSQTQNTEIQLKALECFRNFCKLQKLQFNDILVGAAIENLSKFMNNKDNSNISTIVIEIFRAISVPAAKYIKSGITLTDYFANQMKAIVQNLLNNLQESAKEKDNDDDDESNIFETTQYCLFSYMRIVGNQSLSLVIPFTENVMPISKKAALSAFSSMLEGPSKETVQPLIIAALPKFVELLNQQSNQLKLQTIEVLLRIAEFYPETMAKHVQFNEIFTPIIQNLFAKPSVAKGICEIFSLLAESFPTLPQDCQLFQSLDGIMENIIKVVTRQDLTESNVNLIDSAFEALYNIIRYKNNEDFSKKYLILYVQYFQNTATSNVQHKNVIESGLLSTIYVQPFQYYKFFFYKTCLCNIQLDQQAGSQIYNLIIDHFKQQNTVTADGLFAISGLIFSLKNQFNEHVDHFLQYLQVALDKTNETQLFSQAIDVISDLAKFCIEKFRRYLEQLINPLITCLSSQNVDKMTKIKIFLCLGDFALSAPDLLSPHLSTILRVVDMAFIACIVESEKGSHNEYFEQMKEWLVQMYTCFVHGFATNQQYKMLLLPHLKNLFEFLSRVCVSQCNPTVEFLKDCLLLITDIAKYYQQLVKQLVVTQFVQDLIMMLSKFSQDQENKFAVSYAISIIKAL